MLNQTAPHFLLLTQAHSNLSDHDQENLPSYGGVWRFLIERIGTNERIEVTENEPGVWGERLQLLAAVRGLEALEQPSRVTLITSSRYVGNGIRQNIFQWRDNDWQWEKFGEMIPIKNLDLWQRVDQAMQYHTIDCRVWEFGPAAHRSSFSRSFRKPVTTAYFDSAADSRFAIRTGKNRITLDELNESRKRGDQWADVDIDLEPAIPIKPLGSGRAFGLCTN